MPVLMSQTRTQFLHLVSTSPSTLDTRMSSIPSSCLSMEWTGELMLSRSHTLVRKMFMMFKVSR